MSYLGGVVTGVRRRGMRAVISGVEKSGKTTLSADAPRSLLIPCEQGDASIKTHRLPNLLLKWEDIRGVTTELLMAARQRRLAYQTLVFDSASAAERMLHDYTIRVDTEGAKKLGKAHTIETAHGAYGKAYQFANEEWERWLRELDELSLGYSVNVILTCHSFSSKVNDPTAGEYNTWDLLLHSPKNERTYGKREITTQWADLIGFLHEPLFVTKAEGERTARAISANQGRILGLERTPGYVAGNRFNMNGTVSISKEHGWNCLAHAIYNASGIDVFNRD